jgi:hypothetical protein
MKRSDLEGRVVRLEQRANAQRTCFVAHLVNGEIVPATPGARLGRYFALLPETVPDSKEWLRRCTGDRAMAEFQKFQAESEIALEKLRAEFRARRAE